MLQQNNIFLPAGEIRCEHLDQDTCTYAVSSTGRRVSKHAVSTKNPSASHPIHSSSLASRKCFAPLNATIAAPTSSTFTSTSPPEKAFSFQNYVKLKEQMHEEDWLNSEALVWLQQHQSVE
ncbi:hypothetical protein PTKIN_Ptkin05aG0111200 [Pterospermum kingtungense]